MVKPDTFKIFSLIENLRFHFACFFSFFRLAQVNCTGHTIRFISFAFFFVILELCFAGRLIRLIAQPATTKFESVDVLASFAVYLSYLNILANRKIYVIFVLQKPWKWISILFDTNFDRTNSRAPIPFLYNTTSDGVYVSLYWHTLCDVSMFEIF